MKKIKCLMAVFMLGLVIMGCSSSKNISYEVTKDIYLNASRDDIINVLKNLNLYNYLSNFPHFIGFPACPLVK